MDYRRFDDTIVMVLHVGDEIVSSIADVCRREKIRLGWVQGLGACDRAVLGLYDVPSRTFIKREFEGAYEIPSLHGNISEKDGEPYLHLHMTVADETLNCFGGHLVECRISATAEIFIRCIEGTAGRVLDEEVTGLNLLDLK